MAKSKCKFVCKDTDCKEIMQSSGHKLACMFCDSYKRCDCCKIKSTCTREEKVNGTK